MYRVELSRSTAVVHEKNSSMMAPIRRKVASLRVSSAHQPGGMFGYPESLSGSALLPRDVARTFSRRALWDAPAFLWRAIFFYRSGEIRDRSYGNLVPGKRPDVCGSCHHGMEHDPPRAGDRSVTSTRRHRRRSAVARDTHWLKSHQFDWGLRLTCQQAGRQKAIPSAAARHIRNPEVLTYVKIRLLRPSPIEQNHGGTLNFGAEKSIQPAVTSSPNARVHRRA